MDKQDRLDLMRGRINRKRQDKVQKIAKLISDFEDVYCCGCEMSGYKQGIRDLLIALGYDGKELMKEARDINWRRYDEGQKRS